MKVLKSGFSLIELIIYKGLVSILLVVLVNMFSASLHIQLQSQASSGVDLDSQYILARLNYDIHRAQSVTTPASAGLSGNSLVVVIGGVSYTYSLIDQKLTLTGPTGAYVLNSSQSFTTNFSVTRLGSGLETPSLRIDLGLQSAAVKLSQTPETRSYLTTVSLRLK